VALGTACTLMLTSRDARGERSPSLPPAPLRARHWAAPSGSMTEVLDSVRPAVRTSRISPHDSLRFPCQIRACLAFPGIRS